MGRFLFKVDLSSVTDRHEKRHGQTLVNFAKITRQKELILSFISHFPMAYGNKTIKEQVIYNLKHQKR